MLDVVQVPPKREKPPRPPPENRTEGFYGPIKLWERFKEIAALEGRSASELLVGIVGQWVAEYDAAHGTQEPKE